MDKRRISVIGVGGCGRAIAGEMLRRGNLQKRCPAGTTSFFIVDSYPFTEDGEIAVVKEEGESVLPECCPEALAKIRAAVDDVPLVLIAVGLGGMTGTIFAPIIGKMAREAGALVICLAVLPFRFEGNRRSKRVMDGLEALRENADTLVIVPGNMVDVQSKRFNECLHAACSWCADIGIAFHEDLLLQNRVAFDMADYKDIFRNGRLAITGTGRGSGSQCARQMAEDAFAGPVAAGLLPKRISSVFLRVRMSPETGIEQLAEFIEAVREKLHADVPLYLATAHEESGKEEGLHALLVAMGDVSLHYEADGLRIGEKGPLLLSLRDTEDPFISADAE